MIIELKEDTPEKIAATAGKPTKNFLFATELNALAEAVDNLQLKTPANTFKFIQKGLGNSDLTINQVGDIFCGWSNDGTIRYTEAIWNGGALTNSDNFTPIIQTSLI